MDDGTIIAARDVVIPSLPVPAVPAVSRGTEICDPVDPIRNTRQESTSATSSSPAAGRVTRSMTQGVLQSGALHFIPLSKQRAKRIGADTHRPPAVACLLCKSDCYMEQCSGCDADWAAEGNVTLAQSRGGIPLSDFVDGLSPLDAYDKYSKSPHNFSPSLATPNMRSVLESLMSGNYYVADGYAAPGPWSDTD